jgi:hypothetical protein
MVFPAWRSFCAAGMEQKCTEATRGERTAGASDGARMPALSCQYPKRVNFLLSRESNDNFVIRPVE